jgi:hypothetical protein
MTWVLRGFTATEGSFSRPRDREHSVSVASVYGVPVVSV